MGMDEDFGRIVAESGRTLDDILVHYGIRGQKWGVRRSRHQIDTSPDAPEHTRARQLHETAKKGGTRKLTNKDLEDLNKRLNLEQNFNNLTSKAPQKKSVAKGSAVVGKWLGGKVLGLGNMAVDEVAKAHIRINLHQQGLLPQVPKKG